MLCCMSCEFVRPSIANDQEFESFGPVKGLHVVCWRADMKSMRAQKAATTSHAITTKGRLKIAKGAVVHITGTAPPRREIFGTGTDEQQTSHHVVV